MSTKIHAVVDALGTPLRFILTLGQVNDITQAEELIAELSADHVLADKGYDSKALHETIANQGGRAGYSAQKNIATGALRFQPLL